MASTAPGGVVLGSGAIIGMAVGGSVLVFITLSMAIVLALRFRERHQMTRACRGQCQTPGRIPRTGSNRFQVLHDHETSYDIESQRPPRSPERYREYLLWKNSANRQLPWVGGTLRGVHTLRNASNDRFSSLSWPLPLNRSPPRPAAHPRFRLKPLPTILEKPSSTVGPSPILAPSTNISSSTDNLIKSTADAGFKSMPRISNDVARREKPGSAMGFPAIGPDQRVHSSSTLEHGRLNALLRSKSESYKHLQLANEKRLDVTAQGHGRRARSMTLREQEPGTIPHYPVPSLPPFGRHISRSAGGRLAPPPDQCSLPSPASFSSVNSSILNLDSPSIQQKPADNKGEDAINIFSGWSSRSAQLDGVSIGGASHRQQSAIGTLLLPPRTSGQGSLGYLGRPDSGLECADRQRLGSTTPTTAAPTAPDEEGVTPRAARQQGGRRSFEEVSPLTDRRRTTSRRVASAGDSTWTTSPRTPKKLALPSNFATPPGKAVNAGGEQARRVTPLQDTSGNQADPFQTRRHPRDSTPAPGRTSSDVQANPKSSPSPIKPVSVLKPSGAQKKGHRRKNCVRISNLPPLILGPSCSPISEEATQMTPDSSMGSPPTRKANPARYTRPLPRPPSRPTFDPQISPTPQRASEREAYLNGELVAPAKLSASLSGAAACDLPARMSMMLGGLRNHPSGSPDMGFLPDSKLPRLAFSGVDSPTIPLPLPRGLAVRKQLPSSSGVSIDPAGRPRFSTPSPERVRPVSVIRGPRTPPKIVRSPRSRDVRRSVLALHWTDSETSQNSTVSNNNNNDNDNSNNSVERLPSSVYSSRGGTPPGSGGDSRGIIYAAAVVGGDGSPSASPTRCTALFGSKYRARTSSGGDVGGRGGPGLAAAAAAACDPPNKNSYPYQYLHPHHQPQPQSQHQHQHQHQQQYQQQQQQQQEPRMEISVRDSKNFEMPRPRTVGPRTYSGGGSSGSNVSLGDIEGGVIGASDPRREGEERNGGGGDGGGGVMGLGIHWPMPMPMPMPMSGPVTAPMANMGPSMGTMGTSMANMGPSMGALPASISTTPRSMTGTQPQSMSGAPPQSATSTMPRSKMTNRAGLEELYDHDGFLRG